MKFDDIEFVSDRQIGFCKKIGLDVAGNSVGVASAKIEEAIQDQFWSRKTIGAPTEKQIALAAKYGVDISKMSRLVGDALIDDIMCQLNKNAMKKQKLKPGLRVRKAYESDSHEYVISSIQQHGMVYFKGGNGQKAWARNIVNAEEA